MSVWHFESEHSLAYLDTWESALDGYSHLLCKHLILGNLVVLHIEDVVHFAARNDECVALHQRVDIEESVELFALSTLIAGNLACGDFREYIHNNRF